MKLVYSKTNSPEFDRRFAQVVQDVFGSVAKGRSPAAALHDACAHNHEYGKKLLGKAGMGYSPEVDATLCAVLEINQAASEFIYKPSLSENYMQELHAKCVERLGLKTVAPKVFEKKIDPKLLMSGFHLGRRPVPVKVPQVYNHSK